MTKQQKWIGIQAGIWAAYWCVNILMHSMFAPLTFNDIVEVVINLIIGTIFFYALLLFAFPSQKNPIRLLQVSFRLLLTVLLLTALRKASFHLMAEWAGFQSGILISNQYFFVSSFDVFLDYGTYAGLVWFLLKQNELQKQVFLKQIDTEHLSKELLIAEQAVIKAQINPHFLFNTLNFIHSRSLLSGDNKLSDSTLLLSDVLRHGLKDQAKKKLIPINEELAHIKKLQEINKLRFNGKHYLQITEEGEQHNHTIPPFVLLTFFENALKYGVWDEAENPVTLSVVQTTEGATITLRNKIKPKKDLGEREHFAIGKRYIENILTRFYRKSYILDYEEENAFHTLHLKLYEKEPEHFPQ